jgi:hypothetical protein
LGETKVNISVLAAPVPTLPAVAGTTLHFLNVHQNENTSVVAAKVLLYYYGGCTDLSFSLACSFLASLFAIVFVLSSH